MLTYILGPILALFPRTWRRRLFSNLQVNWSRATGLSGFAEAALALIALMYWYSYMMNTMVDRGWDAALSGKLPAWVTDQQIGFTALLIWALHPLTWAIAFFAVEGSVRLLSAFSAGDGLGMLPLYLVDKILGRITGRVDPKAGLGMETLQSNISSYFGAIGDSMMATFVPKVPDEHCIIHSEVDEILEIRASRKKTDWIPPRVVRYLDTYYRLESDSRGPAPRPFRYRLRRLERGVPGRNVLIYSPEEPVVETKV
jgi:hypothetical protein